MTAEKQTDFASDYTPLMHNENDDLLDSCTLSAAFRKTSYQVAKDTIRYICRHGREPEPASCRAATLMRNLVTDTLKERCDKMNELATKLNIRRPEQLAAIDDIALNMFDDQVISWGRIVTLFSFCSYLAWFCEQSNISSDCSDGVAQRLGDFVVNRLGLWIVSHGGWVSN